LFLTGKLGDYSGSNHHPNEKLLDGEEEGKDEMESNLTVDEWTWQSVFNLTKVLFSIFPTILG
jgi:hypothetical protein